MSKTKKANSIPKHLIIIGSSLIVLAIVFVVLIIKNPGEIEAPIETNNADYNNNVNLDDVVIDKDLKAPSEEIEVVDNLGSAIATTAGASLITSDGKVVNEKGQVVQNNANPMTDLAPKLSQPVNEDDLLPGTIKIVVDENGFSPNTFTVSAGQPVTVSLSAKGVSARLVFENSDLSALEIPARSGYTFAKTFSAPAPGEYIFFQDMPGKYSQTGKMIVK